MPNTIFDSKLIDALGGTGETAKFLNRTDACVSIWRKKGMPDDTRELLKYKRPKIYKKVADEMKVLLSMAADDKLESEE